MFHFAGSSHTKYHGYILEMIAMLELESTKEARQLFLRNWLVNPSGERGRHQEGDLMQEHLNLALEEAVKRSGSEWDGPLIRDVISRNIHHFTELKNGWGETVGLAKRKGYHPEPHSQSEVKILLQVYKEEELHCFTRGRSYSSSDATKDTFTLGVESLQAGKLAQWILETTRGRRLQYDRSSEVAAAVQARIVDETRGESADEPDPGEGAGEEEQQRSADDNAPATSDVVFDMRRAIAEGEAELEEDMRAAEIDTHEIEQEVPNTEELYNEPL